MKPKLFGRLAAAVVLLLSAATATAHDFEVDGIYYKYNDDGITVSVTFKGDYYASYDNEYTDTVIIPESVSYSGQTYSVTAIGASAFSGCSKLISVKLPESITQIVSWAFSYCSSLTSIVIPNSVISIGSYAFEECSKMSSVTIGNSIESIGGRAFSDCRSLKQIEFPNSIKSIGSQAFEHCRGLTELVIPSSVTSIGENAFYGCSSLKSIIVDTGNTVYDSRDNCNAIIETANNNLLTGCNNTTIPNTVTSIASYAFYLCSGLGTLKIPNSITEIGIGAFYGCSGLTSMEIPNTVTSICDYVFYGCDGLTTIEIPTSVTEIGIGAFEGCSGLTEIKIPNTVKTIGHYAFSHCSGLEAVEIPSSVTSIGSNAFEYCYDIKTVFYNATNCENGYDSYIFESCNVNSFIIGNNVTQLPKKLLAPLLDCKIISNPLEAPNIGIETFSGHKLTVYLSSNAYLNYFLDDIWGNMNLKEINTPITSIALNVNDVNIATNCNFQLSYTIDPTDATLNDVYWSSDNNKVAFVDQNGLVKGLSDGEATITAMAIDGSGIVATCNVTVSEIVAESLELDPSELLLSVNKTSVVTPIYSPEGISNKEFEWSCSNEDVAKFRNNSDGSITVIGVSDGEAIITCRTTDGSNLTATCDVTVSTGTGVENTKSTAAKVLAENGVIRIEGAEDAKVEVFSASGVCIYSGTATEIPVPQRGLYVVKVAGRATKLAL